jgi:indolepyruvate decarboxylase
VYEGAMGREDVRRFVEASDCVLLLGAFMTDINLGIYTANLDPSRCVYVTSEQLRIHHHHYRGVGLEPFLDALIAQQPRTSGREIPPALQLNPSPAPFKLAVDEPIRITRLIQRLNQQLDEDTIVIADIGDALFAATELVTHERTDFISPAYYTSMGFSVPAALGALIARPSARVVVICGDGAFQMTGMELSTIVRHRLSPIVIVLDNNGYGTERTLHAGDWEFNEIHAWDYAALPTVLRGGKGYRVFTEGEFDEAIVEVVDEVRLEVLVELARPRARSARFPDPAARRASG